MATIAFTELAGSAPSAPPSAPAVPFDRRPASDSGFSALEWSVVTIARDDRLSTLRAPGMISTALRALFGRGHHPRLADPRLEALRRMAVLTWHHDDAVSLSEVGTFLAAGFSHDQYRALVGSIHAGRVAARNQGFRR